VLAVATGATDAITFTGLDETFSSVMTGNLVLLGVAAVRGDGAQALGLATAIVGFVVGVLAGGRLARPRPSETWPQEVTLALLIEAVVLVGFLAGWLLAGSAPTGGVRLVLLAAGSVAMGLQSGAVKAIGIPGLSTTYVTGTLVGVLTDLAGARRPDPISVAVLVALVVGAASAILLSAASPALGPVLAPVVVVAVVGVAMVLGRRDRRRRAS
jgi:uncharacterized membrane protein YoaK (UPF0700 family)